MKNSTISTSLAALMAILAVAALVAVFMGHAQHLITLTICGGLAVVLTDTADAEKEEEE